MLFGISVIGTPMLFGTGEQHRREEIRAAPDKTEQNRTGQNMTVHGRTGQITTRQKSSRKRIRNKSGSRSVQHIEVPV